jgi:hypothetical protein
MQNTAATACLVTHTTGGSAGRVERGRYHNLSFSRLNFLQPEGGREGGGVGGRTSITELTSYKLKNGTWMDFFHLRNWHS